MRRSITEREVYRRLQILERHSAFKQPYKFKSHPISELNYEFPGYPKISPGWPPYPDLPPEAKEDFGCNPSMLDCEGGCTTIVCTQNILEAYILSDPSKTARLMSSVYGGGTPLGQGVGSGDKTIAVCIDDATCIIPDDLDYPVIVVLLIGPGGQEYIVEVALVDCCCLCEELSLTGSSTVNHNSIWSGTLTPACPGATVEVSSNSGCEGFTAGVSELGNQVLVNVPEDVCGSFTVSVEDGCERNSANFTVKINDSGQGGEWTEISRCTLDSSETCGVSGYHCRDGSTINEICTYENFQVSHSRECCWTNQSHGLPCGSDCPTCPIQLCTCPACTTCTGLCFATCSCFGTGAHWKSVVTKEWKCHECTD